MHEIVEIMHFGTQNNLKIADIQMFEALSNTMNYLQLNIFHFLINISLLYS